MDAMKEWYSDGRIFSLPAAVAAEAVSSSNQPAQLDRARMPEGVVDSVLALAAPGAEDLGPLGLVALEDAPAAAAPAAAEPAAAPPAAAEPADAAPAAEPDRVRIFQVITSRPDKRVLTKVDGVTRETWVENVVELNDVQVRDGGGVWHDGFARRSLQLDILKLFSAFGPRTVMQHMLSWMPGESTAELRIADGPHDPAQPLPIQDAGAPSLRPFLAIADVEEDPPEDAIVADLVREQVIRRFVDYRAFVSRDRFLQFDITETMSGPLRGIRFQDLHDLADRGILVSREGEFGEWEYSLSLESASWATTTKLDDPSRMPFTYVETKQLANAPKLVLAMQLCLRGWRTATICPESYKHGDELLFIRVDYV